MSTLKEIYALSKTCDTHEEQVDMWVAYAVKVLNEDERWLNDPWDNEKFRKLIVEGEHLDPQRPPTRTT